MELSQYKKHNRIKHMILKKVIINFFKNDFRTKNGTIFFIAILLSFYFCLQLMFGRSNIFYLIQLKNENKRQELQLEILEKEMLSLQTKTNLIENKNSDYIDELLRKKLNRFPPNTYQIKRNN